MITPLLLMTLLAGPSWAAPFPDCLHVFATSKKSQPSLDSLKKEQGSVSPEMQALIEAVVKDGGKLTPETMKKLQNAARAAKSQGLDLNTHPAIEKELLERDFDADKEPKPAPPGVL